jgi:hypothetical protein
MKSIAHLRLFRPSLRSYLREHTHYLSKSTHKKNNWSGVNRQDKLMSLLMLKDQ